ncbi:MAG: hypothetical protein HC896_15890 [Bacteroidales bacterium]|nr:hypothetical protein [Bacteroidales bacterium]
MNRAVSFIISAFYLLITIGISLSVHQCGQQMHYAQMVMPGSECCHCSTEQTNSLNNVTCCSHNKNKQEHSNQAHNHCCSVLNFKIQLNNPEQTISSVKYTGPAVLQLLNSAQESKEALLSAIYKASILHFEC